MDAKDTAVWSVSILLVIIVTIAIAIVIIPSESPSENNMPRLIYEHKLAETNPGDFGSGNLVILEKTGNIIGPSFPCCANRNNAEICVEGPISTNVTCQNDQGNSTLICKYPFLNVSTGKCLE